MSNSKGFAEADVPEQTGRTVIVTGTNANVGFEIARVLAARARASCRAAASRQGRRMPSRGSSGSRGSFPASRPPEFKHVVVSRCDYALFTSKR